MQENAITPPWLQLALGLLASFFAGGGVYKLFNTWLNRKKPAAEITLTQATANEVSVRAGSQAGDAVVRMMNRLDAAQITIDRLRGERDTWQLKSFDLEVELREVRQGHGQLVLEVQSMDYQMRKQMAFIRAEGMEAKYVALDRPAADPPDGGEG